VLLWDVATETVVREFSAGEASVQHGDFSQDGRLFAACGPDQTIRLWEVPTGRQRAELKGHVQEVRAVVFSPDSTLLASAGKDGTVRLWKTAVTEAAPFPTNAFPPCALARDGRRLISKTGLGRTNTLLLSWDLETGRSTRLKGLLGAQPLAFIERDTTLVNMVRPVSGKELWLGAYNLSNQTAGIYQHLGYGSDQPRTATDYSTAGGLFALATYDGRILIWRASDGRLTGTLIGPSNEVQAVRFSPSGRLLASFTRKKGISIWDVAAAVVVRDLEFGAARAYDLAFSPDGQLLAAADSNDVIDLWDAPSGQLLGTLTGHAGPVLRLAFSPDGRTLASTSEDGSVRLWSLQARRELATLSRSGPLDYLEFTSDGLTLVGTGTNGHLQLWRAK
jgi:WD40 repeat protein